MTGRPLALFKDWAGVRKKQDDDDDVVPECPERVEQLFESLDLDDNGLIERDEMKQFLYCFGPPDGYSTTCIWEDFTGESIDHEQFTTLHNKHRWAFDSVNMELLERYKWDGKLVSERKI